MITYEVWFSAIHASLCQQIYQKIIYQQTQVKFHKLEVLELSSIPSIKLWDGQLSPRLSWIQNLTTLSVDNCDGLKFLSSFFMDIKFLHLKNLEICKCGEMAEIISTGENDGEEKMRNMFPKLQVLKLEALANLEQICTTASYIEFECLKLLLVKDCPKVGTFIIDRTSNNTVDSAGHSI